MSSWITRRGPFINHRRFPRLRGPLYQNIKQPNSHFSFIGGGGVGVAETGGATVLINSRPFD